MLRTLLLGLLLFVLGAGIRNGWIILKWSQFFHDVGFTYIEPDK